MLRVNELQLSGGGFDRGQWSSWVRDVSMIAVFVEGGSLLMCFRSGRERGRG